MFQTVPQTGPYRSISQTTQHWKNYYWTALLLLTYFSKSLEIKSNEYMNVFRRFEKIENVFFK